MSLRMSLYGGRPTRFGYTREGNPKNKALAEPEFKNLSKPDLTAIETNEAQLLDFGLSENLNLSPIQRHPRGTLSGSESLNHPHSCGTLSEPESAPENVFDMSAASSCKLAPQRTAPISPSNDLVVRDGALGFKITCRYFTGGQGHGCRA